ncbi:MAG TPA: hypothetical protein VLM75_16315 [Spirochaetota bacterium]|nr:hypothetical protein [Spirochaetota bacterium]
MKTLQQAAREYLEFFELRTTENGESWRPVEGAPSGLRRIVRNAHGDYMPDDHRYNFIVEALRLLAECADVECVEVVPDNDPSRLTGWLNSKINRIQYMTIAMAEFKPKDSLQLLKAAQYIERKEVLEAVIGELRSIHGGKS